MKKSNTDEFIKKAIKVHNNFYTYDKVEYKDVSTNVIITCPIHGDFLQSPNTHLKPSGCKECSKNKRSDIWEEWELKLISNFYSTNKKYCFEKLKHRTRRAIRCKANLMGFSKKIIYEEKHPHIHNRIWYNLKKGAKDRGYKVEIEFDDIWQLYLKQNKKCALTGWDIFYSPNIKDITASVDRICSNKDYTIDNIQIVHKKINKFKMAFPEIDLYNMCFFISENFKNKHVFNRPILWEDDILNDTIKPKVEYSKKIWMSDINYDEIFD